MFDKLKKFWAKRKKTVGDGFMILARHEEGGIYKGADIWGTDWLVPVAEEFEWHFYDDTNNGCQYITTRLTDHIFWFIPFTYDEYIYELPGGTYKQGELTSKTVANMIYYLEHWNWHTDEVYNDRTYSYVQFGVDGRTYSIGNNDYDFIRRYDAV